MIFLFAPALAGVAVILIITLRDQFAFRHSVPMLDQIQSELANRRLAAKVNRSFDAHIVLADPASRRVITMVEFPTTSRKTPGFRTTEPTAHKSSAREEVCSNR